MKDYKSDIYIIINKTTQDTKLSTKFCINGDIDVCPSEVVLITTVK